MVPFFFFTVSRAPNDDYSPAALQSVQDYIYLNLFDEVIVDILEVGQVVKNKHTPGPECQLCISDVKSYFPMSDPSMKQPPFFKTQFLLLLIFPSVYPCK